MNDGMEQARPEATGVGGENNLVDGGGLAGNGIGLAGNGGSALGATSSVAPDVSGSIVAPTAATGGIVAPVTENMSEPAAIAPVAENVANPVAAAPITENVPNPAIVAPAVENASGAVAVESATADGALSDITTPAPLLVDPATVGPVPENIAEPVAVGPVPEGISEPVTVEPDAAESIADPAVENIAEPVITSEPVDNNLSGEIDSQASEQKLKQPKKSMYLMAGVAGLVVLGLAGVGIYAMSGGFGGTKANEAVAEVEVPTKSYFEMTEEEREDNEYAMYQVDKDTREELDGIMDNISNRYLSSEISREEVISEYEKAVSARSSDNEKAYLLLGESNFVRLTMKNGDEESVALVGELAGRAEETFPTIASMMILAFWEEDYGSAEKAGEYNQVLSQRKLDEGYVEEEISIEWGGQ